VGGAVSIGSSAALYLGSLANGTSSGSAERLGCFDQEQLRHIDALGREQLHWSDDHQRGFPDPRWFLQWLRERGSGITSPVREHRAVDIRGNTLRSGRADRPVGLVVPDQRQAMR
jgi:hypothetical protein